MKFITPIVILAVCVSAYFVYIGPTYADISALSAQKQTYLDTLSTSKQLTATRDTLAAAYSSIAQSDIDKLNAILPAQSDNVQLAYNINSIASKYGLVFDNFKTTSATSQSNTNHDAVIVTTATHSYATNTVTFTLKGEYTQFISFLKDIESNQQLMDVTSIHAENHSGVDAGANPVITFIVELNTYSLK